MQVKCPICRKDGSLQQRYHSVRIGHYKGWKGSTRIIEWHPSTIDEVMKENKGEIDIDEHGKLYLLETDCLPESHCLPRSHQTHNLENNKRGTKRRPMSRSRGLESRPTAGASLRQGERHQSASPQLEDTVVKLCPTSGFPLMLSVCPLLLNSVKRALRCYGKEHMLYGNPVRI